MTLKDVTMVKGVAMIKLSYRCAVLLVFAAPANAASVFVDFDAVTTGAFVDEFYNGGTDSGGGIGPALHLSFGGFVTTSGFGETSTPNLAYAAGPTASLSFASGFRSASFTYGAFSDGQVSVFADINGTGQLLGSFLLATNNPFDFSAFSLSFGGVAKSLTLVGSPGTLGIDDLRLSDTALAIPEPADWAMMTAGFLAVGAALRRRKANVHPALDLR
jgi:hypothetical protein